MQIDDRFVMRRVLTQEDFNRFARLSGDDNPIHVDPDFAARTRFGKTVAHGMFLYSLLDALLVRSLPGAVPISQDLMFPTPSYVGEEITVTLRVSALDETEGIADLETTVTRPGGEAGCRGQARVRLP
ncbi:MAG: MaoC family dehydratase [Rudaea sp.]